VRPPGREFADVRRGYGENAMTTGPPGPPRRRAPRLRILSGRELSGAYLARQLLLQRAPIGPVAAIHRLAALQAQYSPSPYLALAARLHSFAIADLERCLKRGTIVKATLMRGTLHLSTAADYPAISGTLRRSAVMHWRQIWGGAGVDPDALAGALAQYLATPRTADEIRKQVDVLSAGALPPRAALASAKLLVPTVHVPPSGLWREHGAPTLVTWPSPLPPPEAARRMVRLYLAGYGPATRAEVAAFAGLRKAEADAALAALEPLCRVADADGRELIDLPGAPRPRDDGLFAPPRLLPKWDSALLSHADRRRILPETLRTRVISPANGDVLATYLLDGAVAGSWQADRAGDRVTVRLSPLGQGPGHDDPALEDEARRTAAFMEPDATVIDVELAAANPG
jgi:hypothetical protein